MKNIRTFHKTLLIKSFITVILVSISNYCLSQKPDDSKEVANKQNDILYANIPKANEARFLVDVSEINQIEIKLGVLAQKKGISKDVKNLGKMMESLHVSCNEELIELASKEAINLPKSLTDNSIEVINKLSNLSDSFFDKEYCDLMVNGYKAAIAEFDNEIKDSNDTEIKQFTTTTVLVMKSHLLYAIACQNKCKIAEK